MVENCSRESNRVREGKVFGPQPGSSPWCKAPFGNTTNLDDRKCAKVWGSVVTTVTSNEKSLGAIESGSVTWGCAMHDGMELAQKSMRTISRIWLRIRAE